RALAPPFSLGASVAGARRPPLTEQKDVVLEASASGHPLRADVYRGKGAGPRPFVVVVHGGSWRGGKRGQGVHASRALADAGYSVVDVEYGLAPEHPFPSGVADVKCALGRLPERAPEL